MSILKKINTLRNLDWKWASVYYPKRARVYLLYYWAKILGIKSYSVTIGGVTVLLGFTHPYHHFIAKQCSNLQCEANLWERWVIESKKQPVIWDAGAYNGIYGLLAAKANPSAKVYILDVDEEAVKHVKANIELNNLDNAFVIEKALYDSTGSHTFSVTEGGTAGRLSDKGMTIETVSFEDLVNKTGTPGLVKLDIEGAEYKVIKSIVHSPTVILLEVHLQWIEGGSRDSILDELKKRNYTSTVADDTRSPYYTGKVTEHYWCATS